MLTTLKALQKLDPIQLHRVGKAIHDKANSPPRTKYIELEILTLL